MRTYYVAFDVDGTINYRPDFFSKYSLLLKREGSKILVVTGRHSSREYETTQELKELGIHYDKLMMRNWVMYSENKEICLRSIFEWKKELVREARCKYWFDDCFSYYTGETPSEIKCCVMYKKSRLNWKKREE